MMAARMAAQHQNWVAQRQKAYESKFFFLVFLLVVLLAERATGNQDPSSWNAPVSREYHHQTPLFSRLRHWSRRISGERTAKPKSPEAPQQGKESKQRWHNRDTDQEEDNETDTDNNHSYLMYSEEETDENRDADSPQNLVPLFAGALDSLLSDPRRLAQLSLKAVQYSLILYLTKAVWKAVNEVLEEVNSQSSLSGDPVFCTRSDIPRILQALENPNGITATSNSNFPHNSMALQLAVDLRHAGMPLRSSSRSSIESLFETLTKSEASILRQCLWKPTPGLPRDQMWNQIAGLDRVKEQLLVSLASSGNSDSLCLEQTQRAFASLLKSQSTTSHHVGILLYGEPGCGKSFLVRALAAKLGLTCLVVTPSVLMRKYVGDTNLQVRSLFTLLPKLNPCMVVLDELDGLFRERHDQEHDSSRELKTEFLQWLSGIMTSSGDNNQNTLVVIGATNRPSDVDAAILRRLPQRFYVGLPDYNARRKLLQTLLSQVPVESDLDIGQIADQLKDYTPSDIHQVLQAAVRIGPLQEALSSHQSSNRGTRPLTNYDIMKAISQTQPTPLSPRYRHALQQFTNAGATSSIGSSSYSYSPDHHWGPHFLNMGTVHVPASDFLRNWQDSSTSFEWKPREEHENEDEDLDGDEDSDEDEYDEDDDL